MNDRTQPPKPGPGANFNIDFNQTTPEVCAECGHINKGFLPKE